MTITKEKKIGKFVRTSFNDLIIANAITPEMVTRLLDKRYSKNTFNAIYPVFKKVDFGRTISEQARDHKGKLRYWVSDTLIINEQQYLLCNHWIDNQWSRLLKWLEAYK